MNQLDFEDPFQIIKNQAGSPSPFIRFYIQEDLFKDSSDVTFKLPFNIISNEVISQIQLVNKTIANNSRTTACIIENGKQIFNKKRNYFDQFLDMYPNIKESLKNLDEGVRNIFIYSVMTVSNIILKLSISMAKVSIILNNKFDMLPPSLSVVPVALMFEKYLEYKIFISKDFALNQAKNYVKQFPKITLIKMTKYRNKFQSFLLQKSQSIFFNNQKFNPKQTQKMISQITINETDQKQKKQKEEDKIATNIQFIEMFEEDFDFSLEDKKMRDNSRHEAINLKRTIGTSSPYSFELYFLFCEFILGKIADYRPDLIIIVDDYNQKSIVEEQQILALMINDLSSKVQNKIYYYKEIGITQPMIQETFKDNKEKLAQCQKIYEEIRMVKNGASESQMKPQIASNMPLKNVNFSNVHVWNNHELTILDHIYKLIITEYENQIKIIKFGRSMFSQKPQKIIDLLSEIKKNVQNQIMFVALALIQKNNFFSTLQRYKNYNFSMQFLKQFKNLLMDETNKSMDKKLFSEESECLRIKLERLSGMISAKESGTFPIKGKLFIFYNIKEESTEQINVPYQKEPFFATPQTQYFVHYAQSKLIVFFFQLPRFLVIAKQYKSDKYQCLVDTRLPNNMMFKSASHVANDKYFYRAFGQPMNEESDRNNRIFRLKISEPIIDIQSMNWQDLGGDCEIKIKEGSKNIKTVKGPLQFKKHGFGFSYDYLTGKKKSNLIIFGGGYNTKVNNEEKINKSLYFIHDNDKKAFRVGKTNSQFVDQGISYKHKMEPIYPFIYGIPFCYKPQKYPFQGFAVLNTNGYTENVNHFKKIMISKVRIIEDVFNKYDRITMGINLQQKLRIKEKGQQVISNKNSILSCIMNSYHQVNRKDNQMALVDSFGRIIKIKLNFLKIDKESESIIVNDLMEVRVVDQKLGVDAEMDDFGLMFSEKMLKMM